MFRAAPNNAYRENYVVVGVSIQIKFAYFTVTACFSLNWPLYDNIQHNFTNEIELEVFFSFVLI